VAKLQGPESGPALEELSNLLANNPILQFAIEKETGVLGVLLELVF
jgi:hypothetical protein